jgi:hypothetical protein
MWTSETAGALVMLLTFSAMKFSFSLKTHEDDPQRWTRETRILLVMLEAGNRVGRSKASPSPVSDISRQSSGEIADR